ncbi:MAG TPA: hypothetical protein VEH05_14185 [Streptosporangiaceae bacterium]|nr:hypothetical protein [Streptosporangiaceae bacterium]
MLRTRIRNIRRAARILTALAIATLVFGATGPAALAAAPLPEGGGGGPAYVSQQQATLRTLASGGMPGWQITLIAVAAALIAATLAVVADRAVAARHRSAVSAT